MNITGIEIENFMAIGCAKLDRLDSRGLMLLQGENQDDSSADSNGAGKSALVDALSFALYGRTAREVSGDAVINRTAGKNCAVKVSMFDPRDNSHWEIVRGRKHKRYKSKVWISREDEDKTKGTNKLTQAFIDKFIGATPEVFEAAIYSGQERMPDLPGMTDKLLKQVVEEAAGVTVLEAAYVEARSRRKTLENEIETMSREVSFRRERYEGAVHSWGELDAKCKEWLDAQKERIANIEKTIANDREKIKSTQSELDKLKAESELRSALDKVQRKIDGVSGEQARLDELKEKHTQAKVAAGEAERAQQRAQERLDSATKRLAHVDDIPGQPCGECGKPYTEDDVADERVRMSEKQRDEQEALTKCKQDTKRAQKALHQAHKRADDYRASMTNIEDAVKLQSKIQRLLGEHDSLNQTLDSQKRACEVDVNRLAALKEEANPYTKMRTDAEEKMKELKATLTETAKRVIKAKRNLPPLKSACDVFSPAGVRGYILDEVTPFLNDRTAHYLGTLSDGNLSATWSTIGYTGKGEAREQFHIDVTSVTAGDSFESLSGGEKRKVRLGCSMALQELVASRAENPIGLYIADEIDHALDDAGLERLMSILDERARTSGTVIVVSHNPLRDWISNTMTLVKEGGYSTLRDDAA